MSQSPTPELLLDVGVLASCVVITLTLICFPRGAARLLFVGPISALEAKAFVGSGERVRYIAFSVIGLWLAVQAVLDLTYWIAFRMHELEYFSRHDYRLWTPESVASLATAIVTLCLGLGLLFGAKGLIGLIRKTRAW